MKHCKLLMSYKNLKQLVLIPYLSESTDFCELNKVIFKSRTLWYDCNTKPNTHTIAMYSKALFMLRFLLCIGFVTQYNLYEENTARVIRKTSEDTVARTPRALHSTPVRQDLSK